jgi:hypothetical protein
LQRYFTEPYRFIPPYPSTLWCRLATPIGRPILRGRMRVARWQFRGTEALSDALRRGAGVLLTPNHCRWADPLVLGVLGHDAGTYFHYVVSSHMFRQGRLFGWWLNRLGGYSIFREGLDRESLRTSARILAGADRPLVLFPEGTWYRQNDRVGPLREGLTVIARQAARQTERPLLVFPVALKYWLLEDPRPALARRLARLEARLSWHPQDHLSLVPRVEKLSSALLALKETEHLGEPRGGPLDERRLALAEVLVSRLETACYGKPNEGCLMERTFRLRQLLVCRLREAAPRTGECAALRRRLDDLLLCESLFGHSHAYLCERPSLERLTEAVQRLEEIVTDEREVPVAPLGVVVEVGEPLAAREWLGPEGRRRKEDAKLVEEIGRRIRGLLDDLLAQGPPPEWNCPPGEDVPAAPRPGLAAGVR